MVNPINIQWKGATTSKVATLKVGSEPFYQGEIQFDLLLSDGRHIHTNITREAAEQLLVTLDLVLSNSE